MDIRLIRQSVQQGLLFFTDHAVRQMASRGILDTEAQEAIFRGEIIEENPEDKYGPTCLIFGLTQQIVHFTSYALHRRECGSSRSISRTRMNGPSIVSGGSRESVCFLRW